MIIMYDLEDNYICEFKKIIKIVQNILIQV